MIGEFSDRSPYALAGSTDDDVALFDRVIDVGHSVVGAGAGQCLQWARDVYGHMHAAGLEDVRGREVSFTMAGGDVACRYLHSLVAQIARPLLGAGLTEAELTRFVELMADPRFRGCFYQFVCTSGRKPA